MTRTVARNACLSMMAFLGVVALGLWLNGCSMIDAYQANKGKGFMAMTKAEAVAACQDLSKSEGVYEASSWAFGIQDKYSAEVSMAKMALAAFCDAAYLLQGNGDINLAAKRKDATEQVNKLITAIREN